MTATTLDHAPSCSLDAREMRERLQFIAELHGRALRSIERSGQSLRLTYDRIAEADVEHMVAQERMCCAFLDFRIEKDEGLALTITVPDGVDADTALAPFQNPESALGTRQCCATCSPPLPPVGTGTARVAGTAAGSSAMAVAACAACCVIPLAIPAVATGMVGGVLAWLGRSHVWITLLATAMVLGAWIWVALRLRARRERPTRSTLALMLFATLGAGTAIAWPKLEPHLIATLS